MSTILVAIGAGIAVLTGSRRYRKTARGRKQD